MLWSDKHLSRSTSKTPWHQGQDEGLWVINYFFAQNRLISSIKQSAETFADQNFNGSKKNCFVVQHLENHAHSHYMDQWSKGRQLQIMIYKGIQDAAVGEECPYNKQPENGQSKTNPWKPHKFCFSKISHHAIGFMHAIPATSEMLLLYCMTTAFTQIGLVRYSSLIQKTCLDKNNNKLLHPK